MVVTGCVTCSLHVGLHFFNTGIIFPALGVLFSLLNFPYSIFLLFLIFCSFCERQKYCCANQLCCHGETSQHECDEKLPIFFLLRRHHRAVSKGIVSSPPYGAVCGWARSDGQLWFSCATATGCES